ncbi:hypothetical protein VTK26DRAFT_5699 [Humicola hyalothermophila]
MKRSREPEELSLGGPGAPLGSSNIPIRSSGGHGELKTTIADQAETSPPAAKITGLDLSESNTNGGIKMQCSLPPHKEPLVFSSYGEYETHYRDQHTNRCAECRKNFPSAHLLSLHIEETHDSFAMARKERGERTYSCFVEGCERKCSTPQKRRLHLIDKHMYPKNFFFAVTRDGIDGRRSLLQESGRRRRKASAPGATSPVVSSATGQARITEPVTTDKHDAPNETHTAADAAQKAPEQRPDEEMEDLSSAMSALQFVPMSVRFGRGKKTGFVKR